MAVLPFTAPVLARVHPAAAALNLLAVPWTALSLVASVLWTGIALVHPPTATALLPLVDWLAAPFELTAELPAGAWMTWPVALSPAAATLLAGLVLSALWWPRRSLLPVTLLLLLLVQSSMRRRPEDPELVMLDVGRGLRNLRS